MRAAWQQQHLLQCNTSPEGKLKHTASSQRAQNVRCQRQFISSACCIDTGKLHGGGGSAATFEWPGAGKMTSKQLIYLLQLLQRHANPCCGYCIYYNYSFSALRSCGMLVTNSLAAVAAGALSLHPGSTGAPPLHYVSKSSGAARVSIFV